MPLRSIATTAPAFCRDWRACASADVLPLVETEIRAWRDVLSWNVAEAWSVIEPARRTGHLPGLIAFDADGRPRGWTAYLPHNGHLQVMALVAADSATASALVDGLLDSAEARACESVLVCVRDAAPGLAGVLDVRGFTVDPYRYMMADLANAPRAVGPIERWQAHDELMAGLCAEAYRDSAGVRAFAPGGTLPEWRQYIATIVEGTGCGWFLPELSLVATDRTDASGGATLKACLMLSDLGTATAHIAQLAVAPAARGRGLGRQLVSAAMGVANPIYARMSLLVAASNIPAVRLYESLGFQDHAVFIVAAKPTSVA